MDQILQHRTLRGKCSFSDIQRVVTCNSKQRFKLRFNPDSYMLEIKANQGHSISCVGDEGLTPLLKVRQSLGFWTQMRLKHSCVCQWAVLIKCRKGKRSLVVIFHILLLFYLLQHKLITYNFLPLSSRQKPVWAFVPTQRQSNGFLK